MELSIAQNCRLQPNGTADFNPTVLQIFDHHFTRLYNLAADFVPAFSGVFVA